MEENKILVVDDDIDMRLGLSTWLRRSGYRVVCAEDGAAAMRSIRCESPDLVVLDLGIPAGNGYRVLERLRHHEDTLPLPVLVLSGWDAAAQSARALHAGADAYLPKSASPAAVVASIDELLSQGPETRLSRGESGAWPEHVADWRRGQDAF